MPNNDQKDINSMDQQHVLHQDLIFLAFPNIFSATNIGLTET